VLAGVSSCRQYVVVNLIAMHSAMAALRPCDYEFNLLHGNTGLYRNDSSFFLLSFVVVGIVNTHTMTWGFSDVVHYIDKHHSF